jgi:hypothetical protein
VAEYSCLTMGLLSRNASEITIDWMEYILPTSSGSQNLEIWSRFDETVLAEINGQNLN